MKEENEKRLKLKYIQLSLSNLKALSVNTASTCREIIRLTLEYAEGINEGKHITPSSQDSVAQTIFDSYLKYDVDESYSNLKKKSAAGKASAAARSTETG